MKRYDIVVCHFFIFFVEGFDEVDVFRDRGNNYDISSDKMFFIESFAKELRIELQRFFDEISCKWILFDEIIGLIPILDDTIVFVHLFQCTHSEVEGIHCLIESILNFDCFA